jgi:hypothetical protein
MPSTPAEARIPAPSSCTAGIVQSMAPIATVAITATVNPAQHEDLGAGVPFAEVGLALARIFLEPGPFDDRRRLDEQPGDNGDDREVEQMKQTVMPFAGLRGSSPKTPRSAMTTNRRRSASGAGRASAAASRPTRSDSRRPAP